MPLVTVTYNAWDHNRQVVPANLQPKVGFRPLTTSRAKGMLTDREVWGSLNASTGAGSVQLESDPTLMYVPFMEWLVDPSQASESAQNRAKAYCEWEPFSPGAGGPIDQLPGRGNALDGVWYGFGDPPQVLRKRNDVTYWDISGTSNGNPVLWLDLRFLIGGGA